MNHLFTCLLLATLLQACATPVHEAPPAPCASTERDCGPARAVNWSVASVASFVQAQHG